jgi:hypothetical protein
VPPSPLPPNVDCRVSCHRRHHCPCHPRRGPLRSSSPATLVALAIAHVIDVTEEGRRAP